MATSKKTESTKPAPKAAPKPAPTPVVEDKKNWHRKD
jgi:hypothetical protein